MGGVDDGVREHTRTAPGSTSAPLLARLNDCLAWAAETVRRSRPEAPHWCPEGDGSAIRPLDKMVLEASLLALVAGREPGAREAASTLIHAVAAQSDVTSRLYELVRWRPHLRTSLGLLWVALDHFDCGDARQRRHVAALWASEPCPPQPHERLPYRLLDQAWVCVQAAGGDGLMLATERLLPVTPLGQLDGAPFMHRSDLYALTHTAMYVTDFGERSVPRPRSSELIGALALSRLLAGDLDLAVELALADLLVGGPDDAGRNPAQVVVRAVTNDVFDAAGLVPSPTFDTVESEVVADRDTYLRFHSYHTTFVYALMCFGLLRRRGGPGGEPALSAREPRLWRHGRPEGDRRPAPIGARVAARVQEWTEICEARGVSFGADGDPLLRAVLDAHLIEAVQADAVEDVVRLLGMRAVAGPSRTHELVESYVARRAALADTS